MFDFISGILKEYKEIFFIAGIVSAALFLLTFILVPVVVLNLPATYLVSHLGKDKKSVSAGLIVFRVFKNLIGIVLLLLGLAMLVLPGPGWLTILSGISLVDFPFKHSLQIKILSIPALRKAIEEYRKKHGKEPLVFPE